MHSSKKQSGFTLIETIIYVGMLAVITSSMIALGFSMITIDRKLKFANELQDNAGFVVQKLGWVLKGALTINSPALNQSSSTLSVNTASASSNPYIFDLSAGVIRLKIGNAAPVSLTNSLVTVASVTFTNNSFSANTRNTIRAKGLLKSFDATFKSSASFDVLFTIQ